MPVAAAVPAIISGGAGIVNGLLGSRAIGKAENLQSEAALRAANMEADATKGAKDDLISNTTAANGVLGNVYDNLNGKIDPYLAAGQQGLGMLVQALSPGGSLTKQFSFNPSNLQNDPGYQFQLKEGMKALQNSAAATGAGGSGGTAKSLMNFGEGLADTTFNQAYNRALTTFQTNRNNTLGSLMGLTGIGQSALNQSIGVGENYGDNTSANYRTLGSSLASVGMKGAETVGDILMGRAKAQGQGAVGQANALGSAISSGAGMATSIYNAASSGGGGPVTTDTLFSLPTAKPSGMNPFYGIYTN